MPNVFSQRRVALVVGNAAYPGNALRHTVADARDMAATLSSMGFLGSVVTNVRRQEFERQFELFLGQLRPGDIALFYYSGHGFQVDGENYLVPVDFAASDAIEAKYQGYSANRVLERIESRGTRLNIVILDACRTNPFRSVRSAGDGLAAMAAGEGSYIAFATAPGRTASDNVPSARNGLFTTYLLRALQEPGLSLDQVFMRTRADVASASGRQQIPWSTSSVIGDFQFRQGNTPSQYPQQQQQPTAQPSVPPQTSSGSGSNVGLPTVHGQPASFPIYRMPGTSWNFSCSGVLAFGSGTATYEEKCEHGQSDKWDFAVSCNRISLHPYNVGYDFFDLRVEGGRKYRFVPLTEGREKTKEEKIKNKAERLAIYDRIGALIQQGCGR